MILKLITDTHLIGKEVLIIPPPETRFFLGNGCYNYLCGCCKCVLAENVSKGMPGNKVLKCNRCGSYNKVPAQEP